MLQGDSKVLWLHKTVSKKAGWQNKRTADLTCEKVGKSVPCLAVLGVAEWPKCRQSGGQICHSRQPISILVVPQQGKCDSILLRTCALLTATSNANVYFIGTVIHNVERRAMAVLTCRL